MGEPDIDLYADDLDAEFNDESEYHESNLDLYDDVITPSDERSDRKIIDSPRRLSSGSRRMPVCVGNLTWWTTDKDLVEAISNIGVNDVVDIKFHENRANGQSKGYCIVFVSNENSIKVISEKLPRKEIHGHTPIVTPYNKYNLNYFEMQSKKGSGGSRYDNPPDRRNFREKEWEPHENQRGPAPDRIRGRGPILNYHAPMQAAPHGPPIQHPPPQAAPNYQPGHPWVPPPQIPNIPPPRPGPLPPPANTSVPPPPPGLQGPPPPIRPGLPPPANVRVPPPRGPPPPIGPRGVPMPDTRAPPPSLHPDWERQPPPQHIGPPPIQPHIGLPNRNVPPISAQGLPPTSGPPPPHAPAPHINPAFLQHQPAAPVTQSSQPPDAYSRPQYPDYRSSGDRSTESASSTSESEFDEIMSRNRSVSSSAISRAVADASVGDYASAIETLVTAISLIKQSKVANDERCKILISSLQDTLHGVESKSYGSRTKERARSRERERSRERSSRREKSSRRDRSRSRDRDYRDRSRERDRYHEDRYRDKDRDHDRERRSRH